MRVKEQQWVIDALNDQLKMDLPGQHFQNLMSPVEDNDKYRIVPKDHKVACVMALIHPKNDGKYYVAYIERASSHPDDKHAGQIGFPGGKFEKEDDSLVACALREVEEEIGVPMGDINVLGEMTSLYVFASNFLVYPFVGYVNYEPKYVPQESEVSGILEISLEHLTEEKNKSTRTLRLAAGVLVDAPGYTIEDHFLWGATAMMSSELEEILKRCKVNS